MTHPYLTDPDNAKAYQLLCDCPSGSTRSWAAKAGWTRSRMERFLLRLQAEQLARVDIGHKSSTFTPLSRHVPPRPAAYLGSTATTTALDNVPRYGEADAELIRAANVVLLEREWDTIQEDNRGSLAGAAKILKAVPFDRAKPLLEAALRQFNPSATGGEQLQSLGHPFITKYVINEFRRSERDLARGQLSLLFVERTSPPLHVYGARKQEERPPAKPETIAESVEQFRAIANSHHKPERMK